MHNIPKRLRAGEVRYATPVRLLGLEARLASNDEEPPVFGDPVPSGAGPAFQEPGDLTEEDLLDIDRQFGIGKAERFHRHNDQRALDLQLRGPRGAA